MTWKAAGDRIVVQIQEQKKVTDTGILLPDKMKIGTVQTGVIIAAGPDAKGVQVGDTVFFEAKFAIEVAQNIKSVELVSVLAAVRDE